MKTLSEKYIMGRTYGTKIPLQDADIYSQMARVVNTVARLGREMTYMQREMADMRRKAEEMEENAKFWDIDLSEILPVPPREDG